MKKVFKELDKIFSYSDSILNYVDEVEKLRLQLKKEADIILFVNQVRDKVQHEAKQAIIDNGGRGIVAMATGSGKSRVGILLAQHYHNPDSHLSLLVPTQKLRDENWKEEFDKWQASKYWEKVKRLCYASASKVSDYDIYLAILDEGHNITELSSSFFDNNNVQNVVILTATPPENAEKEAILASLGIFTVYHLSLEDSIRLGFVAPYKISVIKVPLDSVTKNVVGGSKLKPFMTTELSNYIYLNGTVESMLADRNLPPLMKRKLTFLIFKRMQAIYGMKSKVAAAKYILDNVIPKTDRVLTFSGSKEAANALGEHTFHSSTNSVSYNLFKEEKINELHCVKSVNEGHNLPNIDAGIIEQLNSKQKDLIQRVGRLIRFRIGHEAHLYILVSEGTKDEDWLRNALEGTNPDRVSYYTFEEFKKLKHEHKEILPV